MACYPRLHSIYLYMDMSIIIRSVALCQSAITYRAPIPSSRECWRAAPLLLQLIKLIQAANLPTVMIWPRYLLRRLFQLLENLRAVLQRLPLSMLLPMVMAMLSPHPHFHHRHLKYQMEGLQRLLHPPLVPTDQNFWLDDFQFASVAIWICRCPDRAGAVAEL